MRPCVEAMRCGKHVAVEVPAATTVADCWELVRTAEATQRHCFMTENCCYDWFALATLDMHRRGVFGTITHCEGAYLHDWSALFAGDNAAAAFYRAGCLHGGNPYPRTPSAPSRNSSVFIAAIAWCASPPSPVWRRPRQFVGTCQPHAHHHRARGDDFVAVRRHHAATLQSHPRHQRYESLCAKIPPSAVSRR